MSGSGGEASKLASSRLQVGAPSLPSATRRSTQLSAPPAGQALLLRGGLVV